jgi:anti-sigma-K factor RskA
VNTKEYIESGILEAYVLGALSAEECAQVRAAMAQYPEVAAEVASIEEAMGNLAQETAEVPPAFMQDKIWDVIHAQGATVFPVSEPLPAPKVVPLAPTARRENSWLRAAVWVALIGSLVTNIYLWSESRKSSRQAEEATAQVAQMNARQEAMLAQIETYHRERSMLLDTGMKTVVMRSTQPGKDMAGMIYWSKNKGEAYLALHNMPAPPKGKQYQLWVIQDGKPVDMGVISNDMVTTNGMQKIIKAVASGQAFAISLENEGGSPTPTMEQVFVMGAVGA